MTFSDDIVRLYFEYFLLFAAVLLIVVLWKIVFPNIIFTRGLRRAKSIIGGKVITKAFLFLPCFYSKYKGNNVRIYFGRPAFSYFMLVYAPSVYNCFLEYEVDTPFLYDSKINYSDSPIIAEFISDSKVKEEIAYLLRNFDRVEWLGDRIRLSKIRISTSNFKVTLFDYIDKYLTTVESLLEKGRTLLNR